MYEALRRVLRGTMEVNLSEDYPNSLHNSNFYPENFEYISHPAQVVHLKHQLLVNNKTSSEIISKTGKPIELSEGKDVLIPAAGNVGTDIVIIQQDPKTYQSNKKRFKMLCFQIRFSKPDSSTRLNLEKDVKNTFENFKAALKPHLKGLFVCLFDDCPIIFELTAEFKLKSMNTGGGNEESALSKLELTLEDSCLIFACMRDCEVKKWDNEEIPVGAIVMDRERMLDMYGPTLQVRPQFVEQQIEKKKID